MSMWEVYGEGWTVVASQSSRLSSPTGNILREGPGRSWVPSDTPNPSGVERKCEQNKFGLDIQLSDEL